MRDRSVVVWLASVLLLIFVMVLVGGTTRLTGSGLSMVEWHPLMGTFPPSDAEAWQAVFAKYQESPQYNLVNSWMTLDDFKRIFFWEYVHRLLGRVIGLVFVVPWLVFVIRGKLRGRLAKRTALAFVLGGAQGLMGWIMVKSGLVDMPAVSHYRLAAHLMLALLVAAWVLWIILDLRVPRDQPRKSSSPFGKASWALVGLISLQCIYGAFMAGTRAGYLYDTFPTLNGEWIPTGLMAMNPFSDPTSIQFFHRLLAWLSAASVLFFWWKTRTTAVSRKQALVAAALVGLVALQFLLGVFTVVFNMPIVIAVAHQGGGVLLLAAAVVNAHVWAPRRVQASE